MEKLAELAGTNKATTRDEFLHPLITLSHDDSPLGDSSRFDVSLNLGLSGRSTSLAGLAKTRRSTKALLKEYEAAQEAHKDALFLQKREEQEATAIPSPPTVEATVHSNESEEEDEGPSPAK